LSGQAVHIEKLRQNISGLAYAGFDLDIFDILTDNKGEDRKLQWKRQFSGGLSIEGAI
jgi:hypothetical protein